MPVREFNGTSDRLDVVLGGSNQTGALTIAMLQRRASEGAWQNAIAHINKAGTTLLGNLSFNPSNQANLFGAGVDSASGAATVKSARWVLIVVSKAAGSAKPAFSLYDFTAGSWSNVEGSAAQGDWTTQAEGFIRFGSEQAVEDSYPGRIAAIAEWSGKALTQAEREALKAVPDLKSGWLAKAPSGLWCFDQAVVTEEVIDLTGNGANQKARTGTTVAIEEPPIPYVSAGPRPGSRSLLGVGR